MPQFAASQSFTVMARLPSGGFTRAPRSRRRGPAPLSTQRDPRSPTREGTPRESDKALAKNKVKQQQLQQRQVRSAASPRGGTLGARKFSARVAKRDPLNPLSKDDLALARYRHAPRK